MKYINHLETSIFVISCSTEKKNILEFLEFLEILEKCLPILVVNESYHKE